MGKAMVWAAVLTFAGAPMGILAQDAQATAKPAPPPDHFYKLTLVVEEANDAGKVVNARSYVATIDTNTQVESHGRPDQQIRTGARIPVATSSGPGSAIESWQYMDVGVDFDVRGPKEIGDKLAFNLVADISSLANPAGQSADPLSHPVVRTNKWSSNVLIPIGKATVVYSADDLDSKGKMQVEVTATRVE